MALLNEDMRKSPLVGLPSVIKKHFPATIGSPTGEILSNAFLFKIDSMVDKVSGRKYF